MGNDMYVSFHLSQRWEHFAQSKKQKPKTKKNPVATRETCEQVKNKTFIRQSHSNAFKWKGTISSPYYCLDFKITFLLRLFFSFIRIGLKEANSQDKDLVWGLAAVFK